MEEFIYENYLWFIIGGVILLMALIGFIAEKTNFGRGSGDKKEKKSKKKEEKQAIVENVPSEPIIENDIPEAESINTNLEITEEQPEPSNEMPIEEDLTVPLEPNKEEGKVEDIIGNIEEDLTVPFGDNVVSNESVENNNEVKDIAPEEMKEEILESPIEEELKLPKIESLETEESDEDVWKF